MSKFEFFMAFYGILLGLSVTELMSGFGNLLRLRERPRWGVVTPLAGVCVLMMIISTFADAWMSMQSVSIDVRGLLAPTLIAINLYLAALMVVPRDAADWPDLDSYFLARRRLILPPLIACFAITIIALEMPGMIAKREIPSIAYVFVNGSLIATLLIATVVRRISIIATALATFLAIMIVIYFAGLTISDLFALLGM